MRFKRSLVGLWTAALLSSAAALAADSGYTLAAQRQAVLGEAPEPPAPKLQASRLQAAIRQPNPQLTTVSYGVEDLVPALRPAILGPMASESDAQIQLGAYRAEDKAAEDWNRLVEQAKDLLGGLTPQIVSVDLPERGRFYRLRAGVLDDGAAEALCDRLKDRGLDCFSVKG